MFNYLYGIGSLVLCDNLWMTFPRVVKLWLIFYNSLKCSLLITSALFIFSLPAKSHKLILLFLTNMLFSSISSTEIYKTVWDLLLLVFIKVSLIFLFFSPLLIIFKLSKKWIILNSASPSMNNPSSLFYLISNSSSLSVSKSYIFSL